MSETSRIQTLASLPPVEPADSRKRIASDTSPAAPSGEASGTTFSELLRVKQGIAGTGAASSLNTGALRWSAHAQTRLNSRKIAFDSSHMDRLQGAVQKAAGKGAKDALVLMDDLALVVSVKNRTVVTVVDKDNLKQNVFTNIDSAVIA